MFQSEEDKLVGLVGLAIDSKKAEVTKEFLERVGITYDQVAKSQSRLEAKKGMTVFMLDESTITPERKEQFIERFGGIKSNDTPPLPAPIIPEQTVYFSNPNQQYTLEDNSQVIKESIGLVVPAQDAITVNSWLESKGTTNNYILEKNSNIAIFIIEKYTVSDELEEGLNSLLGEAINLGEIDGFDKYEQLSNELNQKVEKEGSLLEINSTPQPSEYKQALQSLPSRPKEISKEEIPLPIAPAKPVLEESTLASATAYKITTTQQPQLPINNSSSQNQGNRNVLKSTTAAIANSTPNESNVIENTLSTQTQAQPVESDNKPITLPSAQAADKSKAIEILGKVSSEKVEQLRQHLETNLKPLLENDKSNYSPGRQVAWVSAKWDLKEKDFKPGVQDDKLMQLVKQVYPDADIVLVTYSAAAGAGINYHRDDSYAATEARSINIGNSEWGYRAAKEQMAWTKGENTAATYQEFKLESGTVTRFNCKNEHAALNTEAGRWSINIWSIKNDQACENSVRQKFENFVASNQPNRAVVQSNSDLTIKGNEWTPGGEIKVERSYSSLSVATSNVPLPAAQTTAETKQLSVEEIIAIGNQTAARAAQPQIPENPTISGKPVPMVYSLRMHGELPKLPVNTTIDAMRGHGRVHTTRGVDYQKTYDINEGDIAIAQGKNGEQVAFRVGKQYEITPQMIQDPDYQQAWANWEKHSAKELTQNQASKNKVYGLFLEPLGDYVNGKIVPFAPTKQATATTTVNISPDSSDGLGAALSNATTLAKEQGKLHNDYPVSVGNNPTASAGQYGTETHAAKAEGVPYTSAEQAFNHQKQINPSSSDQYKLMVTVLQAKLEQHPRLAETITKRGGTEWLENCTNITNSQDKQWEGKGKESAFIRALSEAYTNVIEKNNETDIVPTPETPTTSNPLANLQPINPAVAEHMKKDIAMAEIATQFIGKSAASPETPSSTRNYEQAWSESPSETLRERANTGNYSASDVIMVSGSGPWRGVTNEQIKQTFEKEYVPLLNAAIEAKSLFVVGNAKGTDQLVQKYLTERGYQLKPSNEGYVKLNPIENIKDTKDTNKASTSPQNTATTSEIPSDAVTQQKTSKITKNQADPVNTKPEQTDTDKTTSTENLPTQLPQFAPSINLNSRSPDPLGAVLTSTTVKSKQVGAIANDYPVSFRDNKEMPAGTYGPETYTESKPAGQPFLSAEQAFYAYKETVPLKEPRVQLMAEILQARFEQHPKLAEAITARGGAEWLKQCSYLVSSGEKNFWEGKGLESPYIRALTQGYTKALENSNSRQAENQTAEAIQPTSNQKSEPEPQGKKTETSFTPKLVRKNISPPTSPKNQTESSQTLNADIQQALSQTSTNSQTKSIDKTLENLKQSTVQNLQNWYEAAQKLGRTEKYLNRIQEVTNQYINDSSYILENAFKAMSRDIKELQQINEMTKLAQRVVKTFGKEDINGIMSVRTENYKSYQIATKAQEQTYVIKDKDSNVLLYIREGKTQVNKLNEEAVNDFRFMNLRIENSLQDVKKELIER